VIPFPSTVLVSPIGPYEIDWMTVPLPEYPFSVVVTEVKPAR